MSQAKRYTKSINIIILLFALLLANCFTAEAISKVSYQGFDKNYHNDEVIANKLKLTVSDLAAAGTFLPAIISTLLNDPNIDSNSKLAQALKNEVKSNQVSNPVKLLTQAIIDQLLNNKNLVNKYKDTNSVLRKNNPKIPDPNKPGAPVIQEFLYPTIALNCNDDGGFFSLTRVLTAAGPQKAPAPGTKEGQAGFVATILGTGPAVDNKANPLMLSWFNLDTKQNGAIALTRNAKINPDGPATFTAIANTGKGQIIAILSGTVTTQVKDSTHTCTLIPTIGLARI